LPVEELGDEPLALLGNVGHLLRQLTWIVESVFRRTVAGRGYPGSRFAAAGTFDLRLIGRGRPVGLA
jgi:hypothetical protein